MINKKNYLTFDLQLKIYTLLAQITQVKQFAVCAAPLNCGALLWLDDGGKQWDELQMVVKHLSTVILQNETKCQDHPKIKFWLLFL